MKSKVRAGAPRNSRGASLRVLAAALAAASGAWSHAQAQEPPQQIADTRLSFDIPAQPLSSALSEFARQSGMRVLFAYDDLNGAQAPALRGAFTREDALTHLLTGSGFAGRIDNAGVVRLEQRARPSGSAPRRRSKPLINLNQTASSKHANARVRTSPMTPLTTRKS